MEWLTGADAADARHQSGHFVEATTFAELLEAAKLGGVEAGGVHCSLVIEVDGDLGVAFDPRDRINNNLSSHLFLYFSMHRTWTWP
jgi:hypothetical protein